MRAEEPSGGGFVVEFTEKGASVVKPEKQGQETNAWVIPEGYVLNYELLDVFPVSMVAMLHEKHPIAHS